MKYLIPLLLLAGCATINGQPSPTSSITTLFANDYTAAAKDWTDASASLPAGSPLVPQYQANAKCFADAAARLQPATPTNYTVNGIFSAGSVLAIQKDALQVSASPSVDCKTLIGDLILRLNADALQGFGLKNLLP